MYNKNQYRKFNDKKILHKVKKQWVTISLALLMMIGGGAVATHVSANADTTANAKPQVTSNAPQSNSASNITDQAKALHNNMVRNAGLSQVKPAALGATKAANTPKVVKTAKWDNANVNYYNNKVMELTGNGTINAQDVPKLPSGNDLYGTWSLKIDKNNASINLNNSAKGGYFSANYNPEWNYFRSMDLSGLHTNNVTNMSNMFENDESLKSADLSGFNTSNVTSMDYMFNGDYELSSLNLNSFDTRKASMNKIFADDGNLTKLVLGDNAKLGSKAFSYTPFSSVYHTATQNRDYANYSDVSAFTYGSDGAVPAKYIYNYYPVNQNSIGINSGFNSYKLMMNNKGNDVTAQFKDGTLPQGTYYLASPVPVNFVTQLSNPYGSNNYSDVNHKFGAFYPITQAIGNSDYNNESDYYNVSPLDFTSQVKSMLTNDKTYQHDYTILPGSGYITTNKDGNGDDVPLLNIKINLNASKYLNDANNNIKSYLNNDQTYQNDLHDAAPYEDPETNNENERSYNSDVKQLNSDYATTNHNLTEPSDARTVESTSNADSWATSVESNMASDEASIASAVSSNKADYAGAINENKMNIDTTISGIHAAVQHPYFDLNKLNASSKATLASDERVANSASDTLRNSSWDPTYSNVSAVADIAKHTGSALNDINNMYRSVHSKAPSKAASSTTSKATSKASSKASSSATSKASSKASSNASQSVKPSSKSTNSSKASSIKPSSTNSKASSKASSTTSKASSKASQSVAPSSKTSTNSSKASSSVAPSSTNSKTSSKASSNANNSNSASSQSNNQSSAASQNNNSSSSVAPSSEQQPSDNTNSTPFVPSFNIPSVPSTSVVTPTQNNTTSMSDNNNNNNSSVVPSSEPQTTNTNVNTNTNSNSQVSDSTKQTVNKHHNTRIARNHHAKRGSVYLFNTDFKGLSKRNRSVVTTKGVRAYKYVRTYKRTRRGHYTRTGHYVAVKYIKPNTKLAVKRVVKFGKITKLQLTNGLLVTSNKHYVTINKIAKRTNKHNAKRAIKGINATRYNRALRKSNYVLRHGRRHATRYTYRMAKKFNRANNSEKKAYRKFARKHTNRNRKSVNKAITNLNKLVNALLK